MERVILSVEDMAAVKVAIEICNKPELKREILSAPDGMIKEYFRSDQKQQWNEKIEENATIILRNLGLPEKLQKKVMAVVLPIALSMVIWAEYHEGIFLFSRDYSINFLNSSLFTQQGMIDNKKAAEELMENESLNIAQKYKLACLYCFTDHIPALYRQMKKEDQEQFYSTRHQSIKQPGLVKFWSYYIMNEVDKIKGEKSLDQYRLEKAVESGSKVAVEYCLKETNLRRNKDAVIDAAIEAVRNRITTRDDMIFFRNQRYNDNKESTWVPSDYYVDILYFLLSNMTEDQLVEFLKKDIEGVNYKREIYEDKRRSRVLEYFLNWPYQDYFLKIARLMWSFLPERNYAVLLLKICNKIESIDRTLKRGEEKSYDYRKLLQEFWHQSPERYKRFVFSDKEVTYVRKLIYGSYRMEAHKACVGLLNKLLTLKNITYKDRKTIAIILADATDEEKGNIISSEDLEFIFYDLMKEEKWEILDGFISNFFPPKQADEFKRDLSSKRGAQLICIRFIKNEKWDAAESFIRWSSFPKEEIVQFKKQIISSDDGKQAFGDLFLYRDCKDLLEYNEHVEIANKFFKWCCFSEEEIVEFKQKLVFSIGIGSLTYLVMKDKLKLVDEFISWCLSSEEEIVEFKKDLASRKGGSICKNLISGKSTEDIYYDPDYYMDGCAKKFKRDEWEKADKFLTWCLSSEEEISNFKRNKCLEYM